MSTLVSNSEASLSHTMDCKEVENLIPAYLNDELESDLLSGFLSHIDSCPDCREELAIQFLITEGLNSLTDGSSYDLQAAMDEKVARSHKEIAYNRRLFLMRNMGLLLVGGGVIFFAVMIWSLLF